ncbi:MAG: hypothetical protein ABIP94_14620, partial [Planctomycetota bacterium]
MSSIEPLTLPRLRHLLHDATTSPAEAATALLAERVRVSGNSAAAHELLALEVGWLSAQPEVSDATFSATLGALRCDWLALRVRGLEAAALGLPSTLFDLAEARAAAVVAGQAELAARCAQAIGKGVPQVVAGAELDQEAAERFALLSTAIDDVPIAHQVHLLRCTGEIMRDIATHARSKACKRLARRLLRAADDRELARRLEIVVGRRGVAWIETANFVLLLLVLAVLFVETTIDLSPSQATALHWIDACACSFFVADFAFELALHPRRISWFLRNAATDLLPAIPSVLFLVPSVDVPGVADNAVVLRALRLMRVTWAARYVQALRPLLRSARLLLFLVRGLDGLTARFTQILNREFVFVPAAAEVQRPLQEHDTRDVLFAALRREHQLLALLPAEERSPALSQRAQAARAATLSLGPNPGVRRLGASALREIPIDLAIEFLWAMRPQDVGRWLRPADVQSLDRVLRVLSAVPVRWLPIIRRLAVHPLPPTAEERIVQLGRRVAEWVEGWHGRMLFFADLHGIVTGPQILDRVATAMVKASQRPAVRLLLFGGLFLLFNLLIGS